jgi:hypothetical protein
MDILVLEYERWGWHLLTLALLFLMCPNEKVLPYQLLYLRRETGPDAEML